MTREEGPPNEQNKQDPYLEILQADPRGFGKRVQEIMAEKGVDVLEIAGRLKVKATDLGQMFLGSRPVGEYVLQGLCEVFDTDSIELLPDEIVDSLLDEKLPLFNERGEIIDMEVDDETLKDPRRLKRAVLRFVDSSLRELS